MRCNRKSTYARVNSQHEKNNASSAVHKKIHFSLIIELSFLHSCNSIHPWARSYRSLPFNIRIHDHDSWSWFMTFIGNWVVRFSMSQPIFQYKFQYFILVFKTEFSFIRINISTLQAVLVVLEVVFSAFYVSDDTEFEFIELCRKYRVRLLFLDFKSSILHKT